MSGRARAIVGVSACLVLVAVLMGTSRLWSYVSERSETDRRLTAIAERLDNCTTPTPAPTPEKPTPAVHDCYERGGSATATAIAQIVVDIDCRGRRQQARIPAPPDPTRPCTDQTPESVYPGIAGQPSK